MKVIGEIDVWLFRLMNLHLAHPALDDLMVFLTTFGRSWFIFLFAALFILFRKKRGGLVVLVLALLAVGFADYTASGILKPMFQRTRPCFVIEGCRLLVDQSRSYSFASSHAANSAAVASVIWIFFGRGRPLDRFFSVTMILYALLVGFSRIYVGVHYPGDVLAGAAVGCIGAVLVYLFCSWVFKNVLQQVFLNREREGS